MQLVMQLINLHEIKLITVQSYVLNLCCEKGDWGQLFLNERVRLLLAIPIRTI